MQQTEVSGRNTLFTFLPEIAVHYVQGCKRDTYLMDLLDQLFVMITGYLFYFVFLILQKSLIPLFC